MKNNIVCSERAPLKAGAGRGEGEKLLSYSRSGGEVSVFVAGEPLRADMRTFTRIKSICSSRISTRRLFCFSWSAQPGSGSRDVDAVDRRSLQTPQRGERCRKNASVWQAGNALERGDIRRKSAGSWLQISVSRWRRVEPS